MTSCDKTSLSVSGCESFEWVEGIISELLLLRAFKWYSVLLISCSVTFKDFSVFSCFAREGMKRPSGKREKVEFIYIPSTLFRALRIIQVNSLKCQGNFFSRTLKQFCSLFFILSFVEKSFLWLETTRYSEWRQFMSQQ